jgi:hypothetical protein
LEGIAEIVLLVFFGVLFEFLVEGSLGGLETILEPILDTLGILVFFCWL